MSSLIRFLPLAMALSLLSPANPPERGQGRPAPEEQTGLQVGDTAPKFTLKDQEGKERRLEEFLAKGKVALVFYRSADW